MNDDNRATYTKSLMDASDVKIKLSVGDDISYERGMLPLLEAAGR